MHEMQPIATDDHAVCLLVCLSRDSTLLHCVTTAEQINTMFGVNTLGNRENILISLSERRRSWRKL